MESKRMAQVISKLQEKENFPTLEVAELIDLKVDSDMEKVLNAIEIMQTKMDSKFAELAVKIDENKKTTDQKYNVLLYMISFLLAAITIVNIYTQLK
ncbi:hypothetical protein [Flavobacterium sp. ASW18X]|uniref:hypothetical protein n=1 Tax=Flavobacterium sp. ASW18X TaxID=2572595 RepID=UPI0010AEDDC4|nr:hypothetical protein [Flavobacterium sp. ASW18X]TKD59027.1 hypothetical protein FBT53_14680 [Flavobacterium sp. ASW18X]